MIALFEAAQAVQYLLGAAVCEADVPTPACDAEGGVLVGDCNVRPARPLKATGVGHAVHSRNRGLEDVSPARLTQDARALASRVSRLLGGRGRHHGVAGTLPNADEP